MVGNVRVVLIGEMLVSNAPDDVLVAFGLGSCVAVCLYDPMAQVGGMLHALLPAMPTGGKPAGSPAIFADQGVPMLIDSLLKLGAKRAWMVAKLCGGAWMLNAPGLDGRLDVGPLNVRAVEAALRAADIRIQAQATGGNVGRTVRLYLADGKVTVKTLRGEQVLN